MRFLLGEVTGQSKVRDTNMTVFVQQDISWLRGRERDRKGDADDGESEEIRARAWGTMTETPLIHDLSYNFRSPGENPVWLVSWLSSAVRQNCDSLALFHPPTLSLKVLSALFCTVY